MAKEVLATLFQKQERPNQCMESVTITNGGPFACFLSRFQCIFVQGDKLERLRINSISHHKWNWITGCQVSEERGFIKVDTCRSRWWSELCECPFRLAAIVTIRVLGLHGADYCLWASKSQNQYKSNDCFCPHDYLRWSNFYETNISKLQFIRKNQATKTLSKGKKYIKWTGFCFIGCKDPMKYAKWYQIFIKTHFFKFEDSRKVNSKLLFSKNVSTKL